MKRSTFISYRSTDGIDLPANLDRYLKQQQIDSFCDQNDPANGAPIRQEIIEEVNHRDNFVILFTKSSLERLIYYRKSGSRDCDYVNVELETALAHPRSIIPVFVDSGDSQEELHRLCQELFVDIFHFPDIFHYVYRAAGMSDNDFFEKIKRCLSDREPVRHTDLSGLYWVGSRMSDVPESACFKGYVAFFGGHSDENHYIMCPSGSSRRVDHNDASDKEQDLFIENSVKDILDRDPDAKFMFYNPAAIHRLDLVKKFGPEHFVCLNRQDILDRVNNKQSFRTLINDIIPLLPSIKRTRADCDYEDLLDAKANGAFDDKNNYGDPVPDIRYDEDLQFIVQAPIASGGSGTFILNRHNAKYLLSSLDPRAEYLVSVYHTRNIAVNMHVLLDAKSIISLPPSIQLEREVASENKLLYKGADFIAYEQIDRRLKKQFDSQVKLVAKRLQDLGYRGVFGVDAIIHNGRVNILEVNGRFQASSELVNRQFVRRGFKTLQELNLDAFSEAGISEADADRCMSLHVPFSNYTFSYEGQGMHDRWIFQRACEQKALQTSEVEAVQADGYDPNPDSRYNAQAYLYRVVFNKNIASVSEDGMVLIHENLCTPEKWLTKKILAKERLAVKIALMIQGIRVGADVQSPLREATNNAVDLRFGTGKDIMIINSPTNIRYVEFTPFELKKSEQYENMFCIHYYGQALVDNMGVFPADRNQDREVRGHRCAEIAYLSTDRLRVHLTNACMFKQRGQGCRFCNIAVDTNQNEITPDCVKDVVDQYIIDKKKAEAAGEPVTLRHFLIGGQSMSNCDACLIETAKVLSRYHMPVYVMTLPLKEETVRELVSWGVLEFAYNIEIFNERCREKYMPGKGRISVEDYLSALVMTRKVLNAAPFHPSRKVVRSMVIVGLEPYDDMMRGIKALIDRRIEPMLSVFRPLPDTSLEHLNAPPIRMVYDLFETVSALMYRRSQKQGKDHQDLCKLGPKCPCCQNNTVSLPWNMQTETSTQVEWSVDPTQATF